MKTPCAPTHPWAAADRPALLLLSSGSESKGEGEVLRNSRKGLIIENSRRKSPTRTF